MEERFFQGERPGVVYASAPSLRDSSRRTGDDDLGPERLGVDVALGVFRQVEESLEEWRIQIREVDLVSLSSRT